MARCRDNAFDAFVLPALGVVPLFRIPAAEQPIEVFRVLEPLIDDRCGIRIIDHVLLEVPAVLEDVAYDPAEERDVRTRADWNVQVRDRAGPTEARIDVNDRGAPVLGLHHPAEADWMALGHVGALDHDAVGVLQILLESGRPAAPERDPQT